MKQLLISLLFLGISSLLFAESNEFDYDKNALSSDFEQLNKLSLSLEAEGFCFEEITEKEDYKEMNLTKEIALKPEMNISDVDWGSFAWGFCCWPVGVFTVLINDKKDQNSKNSFWAGIASSYIAASASYFGFIILAFTGSGPVFF